MSEFRLELVPFEHPAQDENNFFIVEVVALPKERLKLTFDMQLTEQIEWPSLGNLYQASDLWRFTCMELFLKAEDCRYVEWNVSPSGAWSAYGFSDYRQNDNRFVVAAFQPERIDTQQLGSQYSLVLELNLTPALDYLEVGPGQGYFLNPTSVILTGSKTSYWAASHNLQRPDFHHFSNYSEKLKILRR